MNVHLMLTLLNVPNGVVAATETPVTAGGVGTGVGVAVGGTGVGVMGAVMTLGSPKPE